MSSPCKGHAATRLGDRKVLTAGGTDGEAVRNTDEICDSNSGSLRSAGTMTVAREGLSATLLNNGQVLIAGGSNGKTELASSELFNVNSMSFSIGPVMNSGRRGHQAFLIPPKPGTA
jgi:hypothetical protein